MHGIRRYATKIHCVLLKSNAISILGRNMKWRPRSTKSRFTPVGSDRPVILVPRLLPSAELNRHSRLWVEYKLENTAAETQFSNANVLPKLWKKGAVLVSGIPWFDQTNTDMSGSEEKITVGTNVGWPFIFSLLTNIGRACTSHLKMSLIISTLQNISHSSTLLSVRTGYFHSLQICLEFFCRRSRIFWRLAWEKEFVELMQSTICLQWDVSFLVARLLVHLQVKFQVHRLQLFSFYL